MNKKLSDKSDWNELLDFITDRQLTPILGKEIYKFMENDVLIPVDDYLSKQILSLNNVRDQPELSLTQAANYLVTEKGIKTMDIIRKLKSLIRDINFEFPLLTEFLNITDLNYYINTTVYNNILEKNIADTRKTIATSINFSINEPFSDSDDLERLKAPFVFNVFGSLLNTCDPALSEEDMLEYTGHFKERIKNAANIINALKNKNLLFLGCSFPDWMVRFTLRLLSSEPMHEWGYKRTVMIINDNTDLKKRHY
jgi:hypothetical protein